jgi:hypothetical protein
MRSTLPCKSVPDLVSQTRIPKPYLLQGQKGLDCDHLRQHALEQRTCLGRPFHAIPHRPNERNEKLVKRLKVWHQPVKERNGSQVCGRRVQIPSSEREKASECLKSGSHTFSGMSSLNDDVFTAPIIRIKASTSLDVRNFAIKLQK